MVAFRQLLPTAGGRQLVAEYTALSKVAATPARPCIFVLGGGKISDAFGMMRNVLSEKSADKILTTGITGLVMLLAKGVDLGEATTKFLKDKDLMVFVDEAKSLLKEWEDKFLIPEDLAYEQDGQRAEIVATEVATNPKLQQKLFPDIGERTIRRYQQEIAQAGSIFVNGPAGVYEDPRWEKGTRELWLSIADAKGYTVVGGGDTITAATKFTDLSKYSYICTAGGAMVRFLAGKRLPLIVAMERAYERNLKMKTHP